ncbi:hypothetical protein AB1N83_011022, partial [Pleurotus pulmonarius]
GSPKQPKIMEYPSLHTHRSRVASSVESTHHPMTSRKETSERCCHDSSLRTSPRTLRL